jgi:hypothetical protein
MDADELQHLVEEVDQEVGLKGSRMTMTMTTTMLL